MNGRLLKEKKTNPLHETLVGLKILIKYNKKLNKSSWLRGWKKLFTLGFGISN